MKFRHLIYIIVIVLVATSCNSYHPADKESNECPSIFPDYSTVTFPVNIAPPNFIIQEEGEAYQTEFGTEGEPTFFIVQDDEPTVCIPEKKWKELLTKAAGKDIYFRISIFQDKKWVRYADIKNDFGEKRSASA